MLTVQDLSEVIRYFGLSLLIYVCNTDEAKIQAVAAGEDVLSGIKGQVLGEAVAILKQIKFQAASEGVPAALLISNISHSLEGDKRHIFNIWREHSGGVPPELATEDPVLSPLALIAADAYPILLLLPHLSENGQSISMLTIPSTFKHPSEQAFETAVLNDPDLSKLFPNRGENAIETNGYVFASTGSGGSLQLVVLANLFIGAAYSLTRMRGQTGIVEFHDSLCQVLEFVRQAARGDTIKVPAFVGFSNISMERSDPTELPWGKLRSYDSIGSELIPGSARPPVLGGENVSLGFVLESTYDYQLEIKDYFALEDELPQFEWPKGMQESRAHLDRQCELTALAFSLAVERQPPVACTRMWTMVFNPLSSMGADVNWKPFSVFPLEFFRAKEEDLRRVAEWARILERVDDSSIRIAQHRLLSALSERADAIDGFIDTIIAWENLFGSRQGELSFRISTAMAKLLRDTLEDRLAMQKAVKKQYDLRSSLLHGGKIIDPQKAIAERDVALQTALTCLRRLYQEFPDLIEDEDRARKLVLSD